MRAHPPTYASPMALETGPDSPVPVRTVSRMLGDWIGRLGAIWVEGEVADFRTAPRNTNQFLVLRDTKRMSHSPSWPIPDSWRGWIHLWKLGQRLVVWARPEFWSGRGSLQLRARSMRAVGLGELLARLAQLQATLAAEGLFAPERKKPLPFLPRRIGLICGRDSDAEHDVVVNARDRWPAAQFEIREVAVQGVNAVREVTDALAELDAIDDIDVIVITRGGGSVEDLLPFSNETLVRAVSAATTPVVSAIGHEQDSPIVDLVADYRASTPTDAGKRIVPSFAEEDARSADYLSRDVAGIIDALRPKSCLIERRQAPNAARIGHSNPENLANDVHHLLGTNPQFVTSSNARARLCDRAAH